MNSVYLNNFRGFENTFIHLQDVNFFLGENSTGKTSILKIIKIISDPSFKIKYDLGKEFSEIGAYYDIVYRGSKNIYFEVGYEKKASLINIVFKSRDNKPVIHKLYVLIEKTSIEFSFEGDNVQFKSVVETQKNWEALNLSMWISQIRAGKFENSHVDAGSMNFFEGLPFSASMFGFVEQIFKVKRRNTEEDNQGLHNIFTSIIYTFDSAFLPKLTWIDPIRAEPKRLYDEYSSTYTSSGGHAPYLLKQILNSKSTRDTFKIKEFLKFGKTSGLFVEIIPKIFDSDDDSSPFELLIRLGKKSIKMNHVGYGVSQVLPLVVEIMNRDRDSWLAIQQPEVHLHPRAQAAFGDFVFAFTERDEKNFIIETHSDFLIDRFRLAVNKASLSKKKLKVQAQVCFFERVISGNKLTHIPILRDGSYGEEQPSGFRNFFLKEQLELLSM